MAQSCVCLVHQRNAEPGAKSGTSPTKPYRQTHIIQLLYKFIFDVKVISGNRTKLSLTLVLSFIASALYSWRHKGTCIHVHVPYASCRECSLHSYSLSLFFFFFINSTSIVGLSIFIAFYVTPSRPFLNFPLILLCYYCHITRFLPSQISLRVVYCSCCYFRWHWLLSSKSKSISNFDSKWQRVKKWWLRWPFRGKKYTPNLFPQS
jgi:hypothetical protein